MMRYLYTIINTYRYYDMIANILRDKNKRIDRMTDLTITQLNALHVRVLVLDFDGVLNSHGELYPREDVMRWLELIQRQLSAQNIFILSNKPLPLRIQFFEERFRGIRFIQGVRKKPHPDGLEAVFKLNPNVPRDQVALVDDRLLTGILATCIAGCQGIYVQKPYIQFKKRPLAELFFWVLRGLERCLFWV